MSRCLFLVSLSVWVLPSLDAINHMCEEYSALEPLKLSPKEWNFLGEIHDYDEYTSKMDTETLIPYAAAVLDPRVKTEYLKAHLREGAEAVIDNLRTHFKELSPVEETIPDRPLGTVAEARSATKSTS